MNIDNKLHIVHTLVSPNYILGVNEQYVTILDISGELSRNRDRGDLPSPSRSIYKHPLRSMSFKRDEHPKILQWTPRSLVYALMTSLGWIRFKIDPLMLNALSNHY